MEQNVKIRMGRNVWMDRSDILYIRIEMVQTSKELSQWKTLHRKIVRVLVLWQLRRNVTQSLTTIG
jgi:hypothetical protein